MEKYVLTQDLVTGNELIDMADRKIKCPPERRQYEQEEN